MIRRVTDLVIYHGSGGLRPEERFIAIISHKGDFCRRQALLIFCPKTRQKWFYCIILRKVSLNTIPTIPRAPILPTHTFSHSLSDACQHLFSAERPTEVESGRHRHPSAAAVCFSDHRLHHAAAVSFVPVARHCEHHESRGHVLVNWKKIIRTYPRHGNDHDRLLTLIALILGTQFIMQASAFGDCDVCDFTAAASVLVPPAPVRIRAPHRAIPTVLPALHPRIYQLQLIFQFGWCNIRRHRRRRYGRSGDPVAE